MILMVLISLHALSFLCSELPPEEILMPWEQGVWKDLFKSFFRLHSTGFAVQTAYVSFESRKWKSLQWSLQRRGASRLLGWFRVGLTSSNLEKTSAGKIRKEAKLQTALKRWLDVTLRFPDTIELKVTLQQQPTVQAQLRNDSQLVVALRRLVLF